MPPQRSMPINKTPMNKPLKTERSHEENQERAYIAASRRSDRSLEARIESARRASDIHKKRTGRALRVTEQDVINEEMYEEEDDDLPAQYRRLTAHLNTSSTIFNKRLKNFLETQQALRTGDGMGSQDCSTIPPTTSFPYHMDFLGRQVSSSPMFHQHPQQQSIQQQPQHQPQHFQQSPNLVQPASQLQRSQHQAHGHGLPQNPYRPSAHAHVLQRSASISTPQDLANYQSPPLSTQTTRIQEQHDMTDHRRMSLQPQAFNRSSPAQVSQATHQLGASASQASNCPSPATLKSQSPNNAIDGQPPTTPTVAGTPSSYQDFGLPQAPYQFPPSMSSYFDAGLSASNSPLTGALPAESQQFLGPVLDRSDPRTAMLMAGSEMVPQPFLHYTYDPNLTQKFNQENISGTVVDQSQAKELGNGFNTVSHPLPPENNVPPAIPGSSTPFYAFGSVHDGCPPLHPGDFECISMNNGNFHTPNGANDDTFDTFVDFRDYNT